MEIPQPSGTAFAICSLSKAETPFGRPPWNGLPALKMVGQKGDNMAEKYRYRGKRNAEASWEYFMAYSDQDARVEFKNMTGLSRANGDNIEIQTYDEDFGFWMEISW